MALGDHIYLALRRFEYGMNSRRKKCHKGCCSLETEGTNNDDSNNSEMIPLASFKEPSPRRVHTSHFKRKKIIVVVSLAAVYLFFATFGLPVWDKRLPSLPPLPATPRRAAAVLHSESNPCYDMMLLTFVQSWLSVDSQYPLLLLHAVSLPPRVATLQTQHSDKIIAREIPSVINHFVLKDRVKSAATKLAVWNQDDFDQLAYYDSDTIFVQNGDAYFDAPSDGGHGWLYAEPYKKYCDHPRRFNSVGGKCVFQSNSFLIRPAAVVYDKIQDLFRRKLWIMSLHQFLKTADQGFLNAVFEGHWQKLDSSKYGRAKHVKFWKALEMEEGWGLIPEDQAKAKELYEELKLEDDLKACKAHKRMS